MLAVHQRREASASSEEPHPQPDLVPALEAPEVVEDAVEVVAGCDVDPEPLLVLTPLVAPPEVAPTELELVPRLPLVPTDLPLDPVPAEAVELAALLEEFNVELVALHLRCWNRMIRQSKRPRSRSSRSRWPLPPRRLLPRSCSRSSTRMTKRLPTSYHCPRSRCCWRSRCRSRQSRHSSCCPPGPHRAAPRPPAHRRPPPARSCRRRAGC
jgi:hypothetical protein